jgi:broad specificity phosphatase PhoE/ribosome-binding protein aMBF1 (putative translation factor)
VRANNKEIFIMTTTIDNGGNQRQECDGDIVKTLLLFVCSAKLWLTIQARRKQCSPSSSLSCTSHHHRQQTYHPRSPTLGQTRNRRGRLNKRNNYNSTRKQLQQPPSTPQDDVVITSDQTSSDVKTKLGRLEESQRMLAERMSISDSVLTRENSLDFHPKNSNWSHFEGCTPVLSLSPSKHKIIEPELFPVSEEDDEEDFLWSEPPLTSSVRDTNTTLEYTDKALQNQELQSIDIIRDFNSKIMPSKLIMVRHGQSEGNVDEALYSKIPDNAMRLTKLGWEMARMTGRALKEQLPEGETIHFVVSPYARTVETFHGIASAWCDPQEFAHITKRNKRLKAWYSRLMEMGLTWHEDPRIREQDFGNYQDPQIIKQAKRERYRFGTFYYRFPHGESASDVFDRVSTFLDSLWRSFESGRAQNYVLVTHGISIRVFLARYFRYSIDQFNLLANPKNCEMVILAHDGQGRMNLDGRCELELKERPTKDKADEKEVVGYKKYERLRTVPPQHVRPRKVRMCHDDDVEAS